MQAAEFGRVRKLGPKSLGMRAFHAWSLAIGHERSFDNRRRIVDNSRWLMHVPGEQRLPFFTLRYLGTLDACTLQR